MLAFAGEVLTDQKGLPCYLQTQRYGSWVSSSGRHVPYTTKLGGVYRRSAADGWMQGEDGGFGAAAECGGVFERLIAEGFSGLRRNCTLLYPAFSEVRMHLACAGQLLDF